MCKVLLQYFIIVCMTYLIQHCTFSRKIPTSMTSQLYFMEISSKQDKGNEEKQNEISDLGYLKIDQKTSLTQDISQNLCFLLIYYVVSGKSSVETTLLTITTLFLYKISAMPINYNNTNFNNKKLQLKHGRVRRSVSTVVQFYQGDCEEKWFENNKQCYRIFKQAMNYKLAEQYCGTFHSKFVKISDKKLNGYIYELSNKFDITTYMWISVYNRSKDGTYKNWYPGHPNRGSGCVVMVNAGQWQTFDCEYMFPFVCEKAVLEPTYTPETLLIALLVPVFSCVSFAVAFITALLVSSVRRGNQPFKQASRYAQKKTRRRIAATWEMIDTLRRASLKRRSSKQKPGRSSIPNIEITKPAEETTKGDPAKDVNGVDGKQQKKGLWFKSNKKEITLQQPAESPNSSLYELLQRLNGMEFAQSKYNEAIELQELKKESAEGLNEIVNENQDNISDCYDKNGATCLENTENANTAKGENAEKRKHRRSRKNPERSFRNMAFRDSASSNDTVDGTVFGRGFSSMRRSFGKNGKLEKQDSRTSNLASEKDVSRKDIPKSTVVPEKGSLKRNTSSISEKDLTKKAVPQKKTTVKLDNSSISEKDVSSKTDPKKATAVNIDTPSVSEKDVSSKVIPKKTTVKVDVHRISVTEENPSSTKSPGTNKKERMKNIVWTYSI